MPKNPKKMQASKNGVVICLSIVFYLCESTKLKESSVSVMLSYFMSISNFLMMSLPNSASFPLVD